MYDNVKINSKKKMEDILNNSIISTDKNDEIIDKKIKKFAY